MRKALVALLLCLAMIALPACSDHWFEARYSNYDLDDYVSLPKFSSIRLDTEKIDTLVAERVTQILAEIGVTYYESGTLAEGDIVVMDFVGVLDGQSTPFDGGSAIGAELTLGSDEYIEGFEDGLIGKRAGETVTLHLSFPADYYETSLQGVGVTYTVTVHGFYRVETPTELTDLLIERYSRGAYPTVDAFMQEATTYYTENTAFAQVLELTTIKSYPEAELESFYNDIFDEVHNTFLTGGALYQGLTTFEAYIASELFLYNYGNRYGQTFASIDDFKSATMDLAKKEMRHSLILSAIAQQEDIKIDWDTYVAEANKIAIEEYGLNSYEELEQDIFSRGELYEIVLFEAVYDFLGTAILP